MSNSAVKMKWNECEAICNDMYRNNEWLTPYQSYHFLSIVKLGRKETNPFCTIGYKETNIVIYRDEIPVILAPLYVSEVKKRILLRGEFSIMAHLDFIYDVGVSNDDYKYLFDYLRKEYPGFVLCFDRISEKSKTYKAINELFKGNDMEKSICVSIPFYSGYEKWFKDLKKSFKQDIRSGYNRLRTDEKQYLFCFDNSHTINKTVSKEILALYSKRACEHSGIKPGLKSSIIQKYLMVTKKSNPFNLALENDEKYIGGRIYIDGNMAAYCQCILANDRRVIVPKLSIDLNYKRYNLGGLLINEMIKNISENIGLDTACQLDLSRGDERYKYDYGGIEHYNYEYTITL